MDLIINGTKIYDETEQDFKDYPYSPKEDPEGDLQADYAILIVSKEIFHDLNLTDNSNLKITTYYGTLIVKIQIDPSIPKKNAIMPLSPWMYVLTPPIVPDIEEASSSDDDIEEKECVGDSEDKIVQDLSVETIQKSFEKLDFTTAIAFRAKIEPSNEPITTYKKMNALLIEKGKRNPPEHNRNL